MTSKICVIGTGYVGMASAIGLAEIGHFVRGYDILPERVRSLQLGITPYREAGIDEPLRRNLANGRLEFCDTLDAAAHEADFVIICVSTPAGEDGSCDLSHLFAAIGSISRVIHENTVVVLRSTVPPGTTEIVHKLLSPSKVVYAPEFLREGSALADFLAPDRIVVGSDNDATAERYLMLFRSLSKPAVITSWCDAELIKGCSNAFLAMKITFANQVANLCDGVGANALEVLRGIGADNRIGPRFLEPGIGFGGPCFEKDVKSLNFISKRFKTGSDLFGAVLDVNEMQPKRILEILKEQIGELAGRRIGIWGISFKAGTDDTRDSMAVRIILDLVSQGANVIAYDPEVLVDNLDLGCEFATSAVDAAKSDALLVLTEWSHFKDVDIETVVAALSSKVIIDGRNILDAAAYMDAGAVYRGIGRQILSSAAAPDIRKSAKPVSPSLPQMNGRGNGALVGSR